MNAILQVISSVLVSLLEHLHGWSRSGVDGTVDDSRLRRAGSRIRKWLQSRGVDPGIKPNESGTENGSKGLHAGGQQMDLVRQQSADS